MDLGLGNLIELKRYLLAADLVDTNSFDTAIANIGRGVTGWFEKKCSRKFARVAGDSYIFYADRDFVVLPRYPVEAITAIAQKDSEQIGFVALDLTTIQQLINDRGIVHFGAPLGTYLSTVRITYTGGFWFDTTENASGVMPNGATALPDDLKFAWLQQCARVWEIRDKLGSAIASSGNATFVAQTLGALEMIPQVEDILKAFRRFAP